MRESLKEQKLVSVGMEKRAKINEPMLIRNSRVIPSLIHFKFDRL